MIGKLSVIALLLGALVGGQTGVLAADQPTGPKAGPRAVTAKIVVVDRTAKALTVDVNGTIHLYWLAAGVKIKKDGKDVTFADLASGQTVKLVTQMNASGDREVVVEVSIELSDKESEAAGHGKAAKVKSHERGNGSEDRSRPKSGTPPLFAPPPVNRPPVSPNN